MRELNAQRVAPDGTLVCVDPESGDEYTVTVSDELKAALTVDAKPSAPAVEPGIDLSPRDIQARIRSGSTISELAALTGATEDKIRRFAHPVLLERSRAAELARASHPAGIDGPSTSTLGELVAECLALRGGSTVDAEWDAWRPADGRWVVQVGWPGEGDVEFAHWRFTPGAHGGVTEPLDDLAVELTEPELARAARRAPAPAPQAPTPRAAEPRTAQPQREILDDGHEQVTVDADRLIRRQSAELELEFDGDHRPTTPADPHTGPRHRSGKRSAPTVPTWEDVLLGVRSHPGE